jgi:hypothetical protein
MKEPKELHVVMIRTITDWQNIIWISRKDNNNALQHTQVVIVVVVVAQHGSHT